MVITVNWGGDFEQGRFRTSNTWKWKWIVLIIEHKYRIQKCRRQHLQHLWILHRRKHFRWWCTWLPQRVFLPVTRLKQKSTETAKRPLRAKWWVEWNRLIVFLFCTLHVDSLESSWYKARRRCWRGTDHSCSASLQLQRRTTEGTDRRLERWPLWFSKCRNLPSFDVVFLALYSNCHGTNCESNAVDLARRTWVSSADVKRIPCDRCAGNVLRNLFSRVRTRSVALCSGRRACGYTHFKKCGRIHVHRLVDLLPVPNTTKRSSAIPNCPAILYRVRRFVLCRLVFVLHDSSDVASHGRIRDLSWRVLVANWASSWYTVGCVTNGSFIILLVN